MSAPLSSPEWETWLNVVDDCDDGVQGEKGFQKIPEHIGNTF